jgi:diguanylate cyclase (GGDEF)-like protein
MTVFLSEARMFAALSATNEAILRADAPEELFKQVCDAAVFGGGFKSAGALLAQGDEWLHVVAAADIDGKAPPANLRISVSADSDYGRGVAGTAFRSGCSCISNDYQNDDRFLPWREESRSKGIGAAAAVPLMKDGRSVGVFVFYLAEPDSLTEQIVSLLERMVENVAYALRGFDREQQRKAAERQSRRVTDMFKALSATNTAILRARNAEEMFQQVCDSVAQGGRSLGAAGIFISEPGSPLLKFAAGSGASVSHIASMRLSVDPSDPDGGGLHGPAFREQALAITYDTMADPRTMRWVTADAKPHGCAAVPLINNGESVGILFFFFGRTSGREDAGIAQLMIDIGANVSFGLEMFDRERQKERVSRMFGALSATNEAIMRAKTRQELFQMVCEAGATGGNFTSTAIGMLKPDSDFLDIVAAAGPSGETPRAARISISEEYPEGRGISGTAFRSGRACISNDYLADARTSAFHGRVRSNGAAAGAALPLLNGGRVTGILLFMAAEKNTFTPVLIELLQRLADNISFALENFDHADRRREAEERIQYLATHDGLTGLPNRTMFNQLLTQSIKSARRRETKCAVLFIDLDRFKIINDSLGHAAGDALLVEVARRLRCSVRESDEVARLGGDEFVIVLNDVSDREQISTIARKILTGLIPALTLAGHDCRTTGSIGIAVFPDHGDDAETLTKNADTAMYLAKEEGKNDFRFFSLEIESQSIERLMLESSLRHALERDQLSLQYQPKIDAVSNRLNGVEALLRWTHPDLGVLAPMKFIPLAEETGLIIPIGRWVLQTACAQNMAWQQQGLEPISMAVNLSPRQFQDEHLLQDIDDVLKKTGMPAHLLQLEITESMVMQNVGRAVKLLDEIQSRGVRLAIDDFGTGYSSMSLLKQFPIDTLKIDRSFVRDLAANPEDRAIAMAIINMGKALGLTVVAEGVETTEQDAFLRNHSCDEMQGYLFSRPVSADVIPSFLRPRVSAPSLQPELSSLKPDQRRRQAPEKAT